MSRTTSMRLSTLILALVGPQLLAFAPFAANPVVEGNRLFKEGKYQDAVTKYGEALVDDPDSPLLNFNMGDAHYKAGDYSEAVASFSRVPTGGDPKREARVAYNIGNAQYQMAAAKETSSPQDALKGYAEALVAYRRAVGADSEAEDAKHNYEFVLAKLTDLKKRLEEQKQQQDQQQDQNQDQQQDQGQQDQQQQDQQQQDQKQQDQQQQDQQQGDQQQPDQQQKQQEQAQDQQQEQAGDQQEQQQQAQQQDQQEGAQGEDQQQGGQAQQATAGKKDDQQDPEKQAAAALIDRAADEELRPDEFARQVQGGAVAEAAEDW